MPAGRFAAALIVLALLSGPGHADRPRHTVDQAPSRALTGWAERGIASYYCCYFQGRPTASGVIFDTHMAMAAHRTLPFGSLVRVTHLGNGRTTWVIIRDRGPFVQGRVIDLSLHSARLLGMERQGVAMVRLEVLR